MDKKKDSLGHQQMVNKGLANYVKTDTPGKSIGGQASMDSIPMNNETIEKLNKSKATKAAISNIVSMAIKKVL